VHPFGRAVQVLAQALGLDVPQPEQSPGRDLRFRVLEAREPSLLRYSWTGDEGGATTYVTYRIEPNAGGTRFTYEHDGFTGASGFLLAKLLGSVRRKMLTVGLPAVLDDLA
jgi:uncharacterized protein YndB with AHSA1/START domain